MFGKLLKYEFKFVGKWYFALYILSLIISIMLGVWIKGVGLLNNRIYDSIYFSLGAFLLIMSIMFIFAGILLSTLIIIIRQFYKNLFSREGYLTLTLPVSTHQIILSKLTAAIIWSIMSGLAICFSIFFILLPSINQESFRYFLENAKLYFPPIDSALLLLSWTVVSFIARILMIYFAIAIGQLFDNYRILLSFVAYCILAILIGTFSSYFNLFISNQWHLHLILNNILSAVQLVVFYFGSYAIIKYKINLQ